MQILIDFVNQGLLPFVGRRDIHEQLGQFWKETFERQEMSVLLLSGEAGIGKSRLVEEMIPFVSESGGIVVWGKFYADSSTLAPVLSRALFYSDGGRRLLRSEPEGTINSVTASLRRLVRLRPTLLVLEDIHLLEDNTIQELMTLLEGIADEPIGLVCTSRPGEHPARSVLSRYLTSEIELEGLSREDVGTLWEILFDSPPPEQLLEVLHQRSRGNPMAIRTALRNFLKSGALVQDEREGGWRLSMSVEEFGEQLEHYIQMFSDGMIAHLNTLEQQKGMLLACLGESFAAVTARFILEEEGNEILHRLLFKGVLSHPDSIPVLLSGRLPAREFFVFTHTLVHSNLLGRVRVPVHALLQLIGQGYPLCSSIPYQMLYKGVEEEGLGDVDPEFIRITIEQIARDGRRLDETPDWQLGHQLLKTAEALEERMEHIWNREERMEIRLLLASLRLRLTRRENHTEGYGALVEEFDTLTEDLDQKHLPYRLVALTYQYQQCRRTRELSGLTDIWQEVERLLEKVPSLRYTDEFVQFLHIAGRTTNATADTDWHPLIERYASELLQDENASDAIKYQLRSSVIPLSLWRFSTVEGLQHRLNQAADILAQAPDSIFVQTRVMALYEGIGRYREGLRFAERLIPRLRGQGLRRDMTQVCMFRLYSLVGLNFPSHQIIPELKEILADAPEEIRDQIIMIAGWRLTALLLVREEYEEAQNLITTFNVPIPLIIYGIPWMLLKVHQNGLETLGEVAELEEDLTERPVLELCVRIAANQLNREELIEQFRDGLESPILTRIHVLTIKLVIIILEKMEGGRLIPTLQSEIESAVIRVLEWFARYNILSFAIPTFERYCRYLSAENVALWEKNIREGTAAEAELSPPLGSDYEKTHIRMIGDITIKSPGEEGQRIRGGRIKTVVGLMVANILSEKELSYREFCYYASGGLDDPERARKMTSMAILRLREAHGQEILDEIEGVPTLNQELVEIDVVRLVHLLREGLEKIRQGSFLRARLLLLEALHIHGGQVPFPTLYDDLFESLRDEIDFLLRTAVVEAAQGFTREGDPESVEEILKQGVEIMPDDEELVELLLETLRSLGKHAEAQRLTLRLNGVEIE